MRYPFRQKLPPIKARARPAKTFCKSHQRKPRTYPALDVINHPNHPPFRINRTPPTHTYFNRNFVKLLRMFFFPDNRGTFTTEPFIHMYVVGTCAARFAKFTALLLRMVFPHRIYIRRLARHWTYKSIVGIIMWKIAHQVCAELTERVYFVRVDLIKPVSTKLTNVLRLLIWLKRAANLWK